jgi:peptidoglycan/xylan/chitin deacetylase (PgdA/CDA1 family)
VIALDEAVTGLAANALPRCATVITIDDGWYGTYRHMVDALVEAGMPATLYACTYYIRHQRPVFTVAVGYVVSRAGARALDLDTLIPDGGHGTVDLGAPGAAAGAVDALIAHGESLASDDHRQDLLARLAAGLDVDLDALARDRLVSMMNEAELAEAAARGVDVQLHTHRHRFPREPRALEREIADNRAVIEPLRGGPARHLCYPSGVYDREAFPLLARLDVRSATTTEQGLNDAGRECLALRRLMDGEVVSGLEFEAEMSGFLELTRKLRRGRARTPS